MKGFHLLRFGYRDEGFPEEKEAGGISTAIVCSPVFANASTQHVVGEGERNMQHHKTSYFVAAHNNYNANITITMMVPCTRNQPNNIPPVNDSMIQHVRILAHQKPQHELEKMECSSLPDVNFGMIERDDSSSGSLTGNGDYTTKLISSKSSARGNSNTDNNSSNGNSNSNRKGGISGNGSVSSRSIRSNDSFSICSSAAGGGGGGPSKFMGSPHGVRTALRGRVAPHRLAHNMNLFKPPLLVSHTTSSLTSRTSASFTTATSTSFSSLPHSFSSSTNWSNNHNSFPSPTSNKNTSFRNHHNNSSNHNETTTAALPASCLMIAQRSSSKQVKAILTQLAGATPETTDEATVEQQCALLAQLVKDSYYKVVMAKFGGARIMLHVLSSFAAVRSDANASDPSDAAASIQEAACTTLFHLAHVPYLKEHLEKSITVLLQSLQAHPGSIHVQSAAFQALWAMIEHHAPDPDPQRQNQEQHQEQELQQTTISSSTRTTMSELVEQASHMYLTLLGTQSVQSLQAYLLRNY